MINRLHIASHYAIFLGRVIDNRIHKHHSVQVTVGVDHPFFIADEKSTQEHDGIIISPNTIHKIEGNNGIQLLLLYFPECVIGRSIQKLSSDPEKYTLFIKMLQKFLVPYKNAYNELPLEKVARAVKDFFSRTEAPPIIKDERVKKVFELFPVICREGLNSKEIAQRVFVSEGRLQHIFKQEVGISLWQYVIWRRMIEGLKEMLINKHDLSYAAHEVGFSDYSHMSNIFKNFFGYNLSEIFKNSGNLQVSFSDTL